MATYFAKTYAPPGQSIASLTGITQANLNGFKILEIVEDGTNQVYKGVWDGGSGGTGIVIASYNAFPVGSVIYSIPDQKEYLHTDATTWKYGAIAT